MKKIIILLLLLLVSCAKESLVQMDKSDTTNGYLIQNVRVFTAIEKNLLLEDVDVLIKNDKIEKISKKGERLTINGVVTIDGKGKTLLPGLSDCHTHITAGMLIPWKMTLLPTVEFNLEAALYSGITTVWDMGGKNVAEMNELKRKIDEGKILGPMIYHSAIAFTGEGAHPIPYLNFVRDNISFFLYPFVPDIAYQIKNKNDIEYIKNYGNEKPDFTKIYLDKIPEESAIMNDALLKEVVAASHDKGIPAVFHIGSNENLKSMIESGGDGAVHNVYKDELDISLAQKMAEKNLFVVPTIVAWYNYYLVVNKRSYNHYTKLEHETMHSTRENALKNPKPEDVVIKDVWKSHDKMHIEYTTHLYPNLKKMKDAKVTIIAGSDAPNYALTLGGSLHTELEHMVKAGMTPTEVLLSATSKPAKVLSKITKKEINFGEVKEGLLANLLLVDGNPSVNITDTQNISAVFFKGKRIERMKR